MFALLAAVALALPAPGPVAAGLPPGTNRFNDGAWSPPPTRLVDATTLHQKVLVGYQGWFRAAGDGGDRWDHWNRDWFAPPRTNRLAGLTFEMWPDVSDYPDQYRVAGFTQPDGAPAKLFSSQDQRTVDLHFDWMRDYGIDGAVVQRFINQTPPDNIQSWKTNVLEHVRAAANRTGRVFMLEYDLSGANTNTLFDQLTNDWTGLAVRQRLTADPCYLHHDGRPALMMFGFYPERFAGTALPRQIIAWFQTNAAGGVTLIGSGSWDWRTRATGDWTNVYRSFNGYCPWNTGNYYTAGTTKYAATDYWRQDLAAATNAGMFYLPQVYPGFSWDNLKQLPPGASNIPRRGGAFLWEQFNAVANLGVDMCYVGMFDEVDEGTAVFKVSNTPPGPGRFVTYEGLPADWYLRVTGAGARVIRGERPNTRNLPMAP